MSRICKVTSLWCTPEKGEFGIAGWSQYSGCWCPWTCVWTSWDPCRHLWVVLWTFLFIWFAWRLMMLSLAGFSLRIRVPWVLFINYDSIGFSLCKYSESIRPNVIETQYYIRETLTITLKLIILSIVWLLTKFVEKLKSK